MKSLPSSCRQSALGEVKAAGLETSGGVGGRHRIDLWNSVTGKGSENGSCTKRSIARRSSKRRPSKRFKSCLFLAVSSSVVRMLMWRFFR
eukprot:6532787-Karenia_brevis.AAC.1